MTAAPKLRAIPDPPQVDDQPPQNLVAEQALLGSMMHGDPKLIARALELISVDDLYWPAHQEIANTIVALTERGEVVNVPTVSADLAQRGKLERVGDLRYLFKLDASAGSVEFHAALVADASDLRKGEEAAVRSRQRVRNAKDGTGVDKALELAREEFEKVITRRQNRQAGETPKRRSWQPVDLTAVLDGTHEPVKPTVGARDDGVGMFYPGRMHIVAGESESLKTWLALNAAMVEMSKGNGVVYLDFEDDEGGVVGRLLALGADSTVVRSLFAYFRPEEAITALGNRRDLEEVLCDLRPTLAVVDGVTEAMALHGLELKDNTDAANFGTLLPKWIAKRGPAVINLDHVVKDKEGRGRYAIGAVHKLNGLNGAQYTLENRSQFGIGRTGKSSVYISKDRPAQLRRHALLGAPGQDWFADLVLESHSDRRVTASVKAPVSKGEQSGNPRPTVLMGRVSSALERAGEPLPTEDVVDRVRGKRAQDIRSAIAALVDEGYVEVQGGLRGKRLHRLLKPFKETS